jgi:threonine/homoserine/homoserine lactone efflux protein
MARALDLGFLLGFLIAASPGPMFILVLRRTLAQGTRSGLISGLGIATGDAIYSALAGFGDAAVTNILIGQRRWIALAGGVVLAAIGARALFAKERPPPRSSPEVEQGDSELRARGRGSVQGAKERFPAYASMVVLTLSNPPTILSFTAVFAGLGLRVGSGWPVSAALVVGVMLGSAVWWVVVTVIASLIRERGKPALMRGIGTASGLIVVVFGLVIAAQAL